MQALGLDPGSLKCGYGLLDVEEGHTRYVECGVLTARGPDKWERMAEIANCLSELLSEHKWGLDDLCGVESAFVPRGRFHGVDTLAEARGAYCYVCVRAGLSIQTVAPATVKKVVTGNGRADKASVAEHVQRRLGLRTTPPPDAADALGVAFAIAQAHR